MEFHVWLAFASASIALLLIPGPTVLLVLSYAISQGKRVAVATAAGVALGDLVAMSASLAGLGALVLASAELFLLLKWVGAAYLIYLGIKLYRSAATASLDPVEDVADAAAGRVFAHAAAVTALNPKSIVFFIAFVPQFINPQATLLPQFGILIATFVGFAALNALAYALLGDKLRQRIRHPAVMPMLTRLGGGALVAMGVATAAIRRSA
ncbi:MULTISPECIES: LysE family translocator [Tritonibacter]|jgi:threonine/homoserine/homoserine lactone efflux protein|uniref:Lysine transporter LysE n=1 Tax=Tritonibacter mobilis F1926 TaxID=1265309 RepID=A0A1B1A3N4_9RHOB|nr:MULTISPECIES: LysE family translocator [Tritonibacter]EEW56888.1 LysE family protein [Ruegeria sp. TrichCH4B]MCZ4270202.1 LysE family translocator [Rhodobacteraceae bacterium G21628-S1]MEE2809775.1 LysE family translocator [Pseudomonadota bacterium]PXW83961.1 threonine/homoserine/homoserine lactone efflux protein [Ruegeria sp. P4]ANP41107.1 lysine transporter LysE [Tritonibacter mobilis F1926]